MPADQQITKIKDFRRVLTQADALLEHFGLTLEDLTTPEEMREHSLLLVEIIDVDEWEGAIEIIGYIAEDRVGGNVTIMVGSEDRPLRLDEIVTLSRRFRLSIDRRGARFIEWRGSYFP